MDKNKLYPIVVIIVALVFYLLIQDVGAYAVVEDNVGIYEDSWLKMYVYPYRDTHGQWDGPNDPYEHTFYVRNKKNQAGNLCLSYRFNEALTSGNIQLEKKTKYNETHTIYCGSSDYGIVGPNLAYCNKTYYVNGSWISEYQEHYFDWFETFGDHAIIYWNVERVNVKYEDVTSHMIHLEKNDKHYYYPDQPLSFGPKETHTWKISYIPGSTDQSNKWDLIVWGTLEDDCDCILFDECLFVSTFDPEWWNTTFDRRRSITINNTDNANTLELFQVGINLTYDANMMADFSDLRFVNNTNTELDYWIESQSNSEWVYVWVEVTVIPASSESTIWAYYYNDSPVASQSNGFNTFPIFDDFNDASIGAMWTQEQISCSISESGGYLHLDQTDLNRYCHVETTGLPPNFTARARFEADEWGNEATWSNNRLSFEFNQYDYVGVLHTGENGDVRHIRAVDDTAGTVTHITYCDNLGNCAAEDTFYWLELMVNGTNVVANTTNNTYLISHTWTRAATWTFNGSNSPLIVGGGYEDDSGGSYPLPDHDNDHTSHSGTPNPETHFDWVYVRNYTNPEPYAIVGAEESPTGIEINNILADPDPVEAGSSTTIKANVTHSNGRNNISTVEVSLFDPANNLHVTNVSMTQGMEITIDTVEGYEYTYAFSTPTETHDIGTWEIEIVATDVDSNVVWDNDSFVEQDTTAPTISYTSPTPADASRQTGNSVTIRTTVSDTVEVDLCILEWNGTGSKVNETVDDIGGQCNITKATTDGVSYTFRMFVNDTAGNENSVPERWFRENALPTAPVNLYPNNTRTIGNAINFTWPNSTDPDGDTIVYNIQVEEEQDTFAAPYFYSDASLDVNFTLVNPNDGYWYYWRVRAEDGYESSVWAYANFTENTRPTWGMNITPTYPSASDTLTCNYWGTSDAEGDSVVFQSYEWYINDVAQNHNDSSIDSGYSDGDTVYCEINQTDGYEFALNQSAAVTIGAISVNDEIYETNVIEDVNTTIVIYFGYQASVNNLLNVSLVWNGSDYGFDIYQDTGSEFRYWKTITIPIISTDNETVNFHWDYVINYTVNGTSDEISTTSHDQNIFKLVLTNCSHLTNHTILTFYLREETNETLMIGFLELNFNISNHGANHSENYGFEFGGSNNYTICLYPSWSNATLSGLIHYWGSSYSERDYFLVNASIGNSSNDIDLYLLHEDLDALIHLYVNDVTGEGVEDVYIFIMRYYVDQNVYKTVAMARTDYSGHDSTYLRQNTVWYRFVLNQDGTPVNTFGPLKISTSSLTFALEETAGGEYWEFYDRIWASCSYNNATSYLSCSVTDTSGLAHEICLDVFEIGLTSEQEVCANNCSTDVSTVLGCALGNTTGRTFRYVLRGRFQVWHELFSNIITFVTSVPTFGMMGILLTGGIVITLGFMGSWNPAVSIGLQAIGVFSCWVFGLFVVTNPIHILSIILVLGTSIYLLRS